MRIIFLPIVIACLSLGGFAQTVAPQQPLPSIPAWTAPPTRLKAKTPFAPKPTTGNNIFKGEKEKWLLDAILTVEGSFITEIADRSINDYVSQLGNNLVLYSAAPQRQYHFAVVDDNDENAFCIGAGHIYVDLGMLKAVTSEDELAAVVAHEIGHDQFGHIPKTVTRQLFWMTGVTKVASAAEAEQDLRDLLQKYRENDLAPIGESLLGWSRNDELQADKAGFYNMYKAGYNPEAMKNVFRRFVAEEKKGPAYQDEYFFNLLFGSHPPSSQRVTALKWESNWITMPKKDESYKNSAFDAMKARVSRM